MKHLLFSLLFLLVLASACKKTTDSSHQPTNYKVNNITDITLDTGNGYNTLLQYELVATGPVQETVTLSFEDLPKGIIMDTTEYLTCSGIPGFTAYIHLITADTLKLQGNYKVKLVCTGSVTGKKYYDVNLKVATTQQHLLGAPRPCDILAGVKDRDGNSIVFRKGLVSFSGFGLKHGDWRFSVTMDCDGNFDIDNIITTTGTVISSGHGKFTIGRYAWDFSGDVTYREKGVTYDKEPFYIYIRW